MAKPKKTHRWEEIVAWAEEYKRDYSYWRIGKLFKVSHKVVRQLLNENKVALQLQTKEDLAAAGLKKCWSCNEIKPLAHFGPSSQIKDGKHSYCHECVKQNSKQYRDENLELRLIAERKWYDKNKEKKSTWRKGYEAKRKDDPIFCLKKRIRNRIRDALKNNKKPDSPIKCLGCTLKELKDYLEQMFYDNPLTGEKMTWENYTHAGWHLDHKIPLASFDLTNLKQFGEACHYTNLQPLWVCDHKTKTVKDLQLLKNKNIHQEKSK
jgi:hypothetical protein